MKYSKYYSELAENEWDTYRDLQKVFQSNIFALKKFDRKNTLLIDSESEKVQLWLENSLIIDPYTKEDVNRIINVNSKNEEDKFRGDKWQKEYIQKVTLFILDLLTNGNSVQTYLCDTLQDFDYL